MPHAEIVGVQEARVLAAFLRHADADGNIDVDKTQIGSDLSRIAMGGNRLDTLLCDLDKAGIIHYEEIGEDGFAPIIIARTSNRTATYLVGLIERIEADYLAVTQRLENILGFDPDALSDRVTETRLRLDEVNAIVSSDPALESLKGPVQEVATQFSSVSSVFSQYDDIYKSIVAPVQREGQRGIKITVIWAIAGIVASTLVSLVIANWSPILSWFN